MCIAIIKPKNVDFPSMKQFENCFNTNPDGAGFMYVNNGSIVLKKGFMSFKEFINAFEQENISKDKLVFFHFRIATHGLIDEGNTHPFPVVNDVNILRQTTMNFKGFGLIHNGVLTYPSYEYDRYGGNKYISDTMLLSIKLSDKLHCVYKTTITKENAIVTHLKSKDDDKDLIEYIENSIGYNKIAIMNENEEYVKYGNWILDNGIFYSNDDYCDCDCYNYANYGLEYCSCCQSYIHAQSVQETTAGFICNDCLKQFDMQKCNSCGILMFKIDVHNTNLCECCLKDFQEQICDCCNEPIPNNQLYLTNNNDILCESCYKITKKKQRG